MKQPLYMLRLIFLFFTLIIYTHASSIPIEINSTIDGEWTSESDILSGSNVYATFYTFIIERKTDISITLTGSNSNLIILDANNTTSVDLHGSNTITANLTAGEYTIIATQRNKKLISIA